MSLQERQQRINAFNAALLERQEETNARNLTQAGEVLTDIKVAEMLEDIAGDSWKEGKVSMSATTGATYSGVGVILDSNNFPFLWIGESGNSEFVLNRSIQKSEIHVYIPTPTERDISTIEIYPVNCFGTLDQQNRPLSVARTVYEQGLKVGISQTATLESHRVGKLIPTKEVSIGDSNLALQVEKAILELVDGLDYIHGKPAEVRATIERFLKELPPQIRKERGQVNFEALRQWGYELRGWDHGWKQAYQLADRIGHDWFGKAPR